MRDKHFITAVKDGKYISINEFKSGVGLKCDCICPECGKPVVSNVTAKHSDQLKRVFTNHFSHKSDTNCTGGHGETELHLFAKQILEENNSLVVPSIISGSNELNYNRAICEPAFPVEKFKQKRPDILLYDDSSNVICAIEIVVTNPVSEEKRGLYEENKLKCLSIDLSDFYGNPNKKEAIKNQVSIEVLKKVRRKEWIWRDEKIPEIEGLVEDYKKEKTQAESKKISYEINPLWIAIATVVGYAFRKPILNFIKKLFKG